jgi:hypothetical protein
MICLNKTSVSLSVFLVSVDIPLGRALIPQAVTPAKAGVQLLFKLNRPKLDASLHVGITDLVCLLKCPCIRLPS